MYRTGFISPPYHYPSTSTVPVLPYCHTVISTTPTPPFSTSGSCCQLCLTLFNPSFNRFNQFKFLYRLNSTNPVSAHWLIGSKCRFNDNNNSTTQLASPPLFEFEDKLFHWLIGVKCQNLCYLNLSFYFNLLSHFQLLCSLPSHCC